MLNIITSDAEYYNEQENKFYREEGAALTLEHSLISISKWESIYEKPFFNTRLTRAELIDYVKCMSINKGVPNRVYEHLSIEDIQKIKEYMDAKHSATIIRRRNHMPNTNKFVTSEEIYYWMFSYRIPIECEKWHINRLLTLIDIFSVSNDKSSAGNKMSQREIFEENRRLNEERKKLYNSKG